MLAPLTASFLNRIEAQRRSHAAQLAMSSGWDYADTSATLRRVR
jgi:hypothetical protein